LKVFKNENGEFACSANIQTEGEIRGVLNLFRASLVAFPGENVMGEAEIFSTTYLKEALKTVPISSASLSREVRQRYHYKFTKSYNILCMFYMFYNNNILGADRIRS